jgi:hypothetical protein
VVSIVVFVVWMVNFMSGFMAQLPQYGSYSS